MEKQESGDGIEAEVQIVSIRSWEFRYWNGPDCVTINFGGASSSAGFCFPGGDRSAGAESFQWLIAFATLGRFNIWDLHIDSFD